MSERMREWESASEIICDEEIFHLLKCKIENEYKEYHLFISEWK